MQDVIGEDTDPSSLSALVINVYIKERFRAVVYSEHGIDSGCQAANRIVAMVVYAGSFLVLALVCNATFKPGTPEADFLPGADGR